MIKNANQKEIPGYPKYKYVRGSIISFHKCTEGKKLAPECFTPQREPIYNLYYQGGHTYLSISQIQAMVHQYEAIKEDFTGSTRFIYACEVEMPEVKFVKLQKSPENLTYLVY